VTADARQDGSVLLLTTGLVAVIAMLVAVVTATSQVFLADRSLAAATDALALSAAQAVDLDAVYAGRTDDGDAVPLVAADARRAVADHARAAALDQTFTDFTVVEVAVSGDLVTVRTRAVVRLALVGSATGDRGVIEVTAESTARSRVR
jgi:hypothetical protein